VQGFIGEEGLGDIEEAQLKGLALLAPVGFGAGGCHVITSRVLIGITTPITIAGVRRDDK